MSVFLCVRVQAAYNQLVSVSDTTSTAKTKLLATRRRDSQRLGAIDETLQSVPARLHTELPACPRGGGVTACGRQTWTSDCKQRSASLTEDSSSSQHAAVSTNSTTTTTTATTTTTTTTRRGLQRLRCDWSSLDSSQPSCSNVVTGRCSPPLHRAPSPPPPALPPRVPRLPRPTRTTRSVDVTLPRRQQRATRSLSTAETVTETAGGRHCQSLQQQQQQQLVGSHHRRSESESERQDTEKDGQALGVESDEEASDSVFEARPSSPSSTDTDHHHQQQQLEQQQRRNTVS